MQSKLKVSVNKNPTKEGIKVQFALPQLVDPDTKASMTQKLQTKLSQELAQYNMTISIDTDVPDPNTIGFIIPIQDIKLIIKNILKNTPEPTEQPVPPAETK
jgi:hypothetical protein